MKHILILAALLCCVAAPVVGAELAVGDSAPDFSLVGTDGETYRLSDLRGKAVVLAWFPKAFTGG